MLGHPPRPGFHTVTPYLLVDDLERMIAFVRQAFNAGEHYRTQGGGGGTHVEVRIGDSMVMMGSSEARPAMLFLYVEDVDAVYAAALAAGATSIMPPTDDVFGEPRGAGIHDPCGNDWYFANWAERPGGPPPAGAPPPTSG